MFDRGAIENFGARDASAGRRNGSRRSTIIIEGEGGSGKGEKKGTAKGGRKGNGKGTERPALADRKSEEGGKREAERGMMKSLTGRREHNAPWSTLRHPPPLDPSTP